MGASQKGGEVAEAASFGKEEDASWKLDPLYFGIARGELVVYSIAGGFPGRTGADRMVFAVVRER